MVTNRMPDITPYTDLTQGAKKIYQGKYYMDRETDQVYEFVSFMSYVEDGRVSARNVTKDITELLTYPQWFSLVSVSAPKKSKKKQKP